MYVDGIMIPGAALANGESIIREVTLDELTCVHLESNGHTVFFAEGAASESLVDDDSRQMFDNATENTRPYPDSMREPVRFCAPRVEQGWEAAGVSGSRAAPRPCKFRQTGTFSITTAGREASRHRRSQRSCKQWVPISITDNP
jgi:hypothetical protein